MKLGYIHCMEEHSAAISTAQLIFTIEVYGQHAVPSTGATTRLTQGIKLTL